MTSTNQLILATGVLKSSNLVYLTVGMVVNMTVLDFGEDIKCIDSRCTANSSMAYSTESEIKMEILLHAEDHIPCSFDKNM